MKISLLLLILSASLLADVPASPPNTSDGATNHGSWEKKRYRIKGVVFQKVPEGLIILASAPKQTSNPVKDSSNNMLAHSLKFVLGDVFLVNYNGKESDNSPIDVDAYLDGEYSYTNTEGDLITLKRYSFVIPHSVTP